MYVFFGTRTQWCIFFIHIVTLARCIIITLYCVAARARAFQLLSFASFGSNAAKVHHYTVLLLLLLYYVFHFSIWIWVRGPRSQASWRFRKTSPLLTHGTVTHNFVGLVRSKIKTTLRYSRCTCAAPIISVASCSGCVRTRMQVCRAKWLCCTNCKCLMLLIDSFESLFARKIFQGWLFLYEENFALECTLDFRIECLLAWMNCIRNLYIGNFISRIFALGIILSYNCEIWIFARNLHWCEYTCPFI